ncbi:hypothetical protein MSAN_00184500 [Mycena sanguinolenta]|uniref:Uncharacterized protein n=1 Tax=Mycena sanguinolenta TaxID=230812 RepID=A0A8H6ZHR4_9AGAR|nr:hypothetical protein MSAN_00184500 [Mycena sanguinolenta]
MRHLVTARAFGTAARPNAPSMQMRTNGDWVEVKMVRDFHVALLSAGVWAAPAATTFLLHQVVGGRSSIFLDFAHYYSRQKLQDLDQGLAKVETDLLNVSAFLYSGALANRLGYRPADYGHWQWPQDQVKPEDVSGDGAPRNEA